MQSRVFIFLSVLIAVLFLAGCAIPGGTRTGSARNAQPEIIDAHTHCVFNNSPEKTSKIMQSREEYLKEMAENNVVGAVAHTGYIGDYYEDLKGRNVVFCYGVGHKIDEEDIRATKRAIPEEHWKAVFHDNAIKVFKMK